MEDYVGYCQVEVADPQLGLTIPVAMLYPTRTLAAEETVGAYRLNVARDAPVREGVFPLVLISHGTGGSPLVYRTLAHHLAHNGFVVGLPEHPFNNRDNNSWEGTIENLTARPRHLQLIINHVFTQDHFANHLIPDTVAIIGHSLGGYTALALAGGVPTTSPNESPDGQRHPIPTMTDGRVKALALLAPATPWFMDEGALRNVRVPILMLTAEKDAHTSPEHARIVLAGISNAEQIEHRVVQNAGHFSFLSPFPEARTTPAFPPSQDPIGFNRPRFHEELNAEVLAFLVKKVSK